VSGQAHSIVGGSAWEPTPWRATQRAAWSEQDGSEVLGTGRKFTNWEAVAAGTSLADSWTQGEGRFAVKARPRILVIDDSDDARDAFATVLQLEGFTVEEARDGREGLEKAAQSPPDIIITDLRMPVMDGREMIRRLRADHRTCRIPIIAYSGEERPGKEYTLPDAFVPKPCPLDLLLLEVHGVLRRCAAA
jgi:CheY-like chemotaxis protein